MNFQFIKIRISLLFLILINSIIFLLISKRQIRIFSTIQYYFKLQRVDKRKIVDEKNILKRFIGISIKKWSFFSRRIVNSNFELLVKLLFHGAEAAICESLIDNEKAYEACVFYTSLRQNSRNSLFENYLVS